MPEQSPLFRRDQSDAISPRNLADESTYAEHVVHARGKRSRYTAVSKDPDAIRDFGPQLWAADRPRLRADAHRVVDHETLATHLRDEVQSGDPDARELAARALVRVLRRKEALVHWTFDHAGVERKDLITWAATRVRNYFTRAS